MPLSSSPPCFPDSSVRDKVRELFLDAGYLDAPLRARLGAAQEDSVRSLGRRVLEERVAVVGGRLGALLELFLLGRELGECRGEAVLGSDAVGALVASGLARREGEALLPGAQLSTIAELIIAADLVALHESGAEDFVTSPFGATRAFAELVMPRKVGNVLDLGCGSGVLGALAASHSDRVVGTDVSSRAVAFSRFNVELNGLNGMEVRQGNLFEPVAGERFDLIVCNPPYALSPEQSFLYRDGRGEIGRRIVGQAPAHLDDDGSLQIMLEWPQGNGDWREVPASWLADSPCDAWLLRRYELGAREYAEHWLRQEFAGASPPADAVARWMNHLALIGADSVGGGMLILRRAGREAPTRTLRDAPPMSSRGGGEAVARWVDAQSLAASVADPAELLDVPLCPAPGLRRTVRAVASGEGWQAQSRELRLEKGLRFCVQVDPVAEEIVGLLDGERTPRQALDAFAERHGVESARFVAGLGPALVKMLRLGVVAPRAR